MKIHSITFSSLGLSLLSSCAGGASSVGQSAVNAQRNGAVATNAGGAQDNYRVIEGTGAGSGSVNRPVTMGRDDAPALVTLQGRAPANNTARNITVEPGSVPGVVPSSGGYIVRRAGATGGAGGAADDSRTVASGSTGLSAGAPEGARRVEREFDGSSPGSASGGSATSPSVATIGRVSAPRPVAQSAPRVTSNSAGSSRTRSGGDAPAAAGAGMRAPMTAPADEIVAMDRAPIEPSAPRMMPIGPGARPTPVIPTGSTVTVTTTVAVTPPVIVEAQQEPAGLLTAATVGDADRFASYADYLSRHQSEAGELRLDMSRRLRIRVVDSQGRGVSAARVRLSNQGGTVEALTHADGSYDYFPGLSTAPLAGVARLDVQVESLSVGADVQIPTQGDGQPVMVRLNAAVVPPAPVLDLGFVIDVTGSMGDELRYVNREVASIVQRIERESPGVRVRLSATFYRDRVDEAVVQQIPFTTNVQGFAAAMQNVYASGGGDYPEDMSAGLDAALNRLSWSDGAAVRVMVVIADAPPQHYGDTNFTYREAMVRAAQRGIRILPVAASGSDRRVEFLFRAMGAYTSTPYVYLTDDSGIGGSHMEADTDRVAVERFNDALVRLVSSDLRGEGMHEPGRLGAERN
jgi:hypothetical protein